jgi:hypothetical protein
MFVSWMAIVDSFLLTGCPPAHDLLVKAVRLGLARIILFRSCVMSVDAVLALFDLLLGRLVTATIDDWAIEQSGGIGGR